MRLKWVGQLAWHRRAMTRFCRALDLRCLVLGVALLGPGGAPAQQVYKWVDAQGVTHYTSSPPPPGVAAKVLQAPPVPTPPASTANPAQRQIDQAKRLSAEREQAEASQRQARDAAQQAQATQLAECANARQQLDAVSRGGPVFRYNTTGGRDYLPDSERDAEIARWQQQVNTLCQAAGSQQDTATQQRRQDAQALAQCRAAQDALRDLQVDSARSVPSDLAAARERVQRLCASP